MQLRAHSLACRSSNATLLPTVARSRLHRSAAWPISAGEAPGFAEEPPSQQKWDWQPRKPSQPRSSPQRGGQLKHRQSKPRRHSRQRSERDPAIEYSRRIKEESSITGVALLVQSAESEGALNQINLAAALDRTVKLDKQANSRERGGVAAWAVLRPLSMTLLQELDAWALVALLRAASHFGSFSADELKAWQAALKSQQLEVLPEVAASNTLLSLHTLIAGSEALKAAIDASLVVRLVQRWLQLVPGMLSIDACQGLYGAVCLGYPFSQQELNRITQQALKVDGRFTAANGAQLFRAWSLLDAAWREWDIGRQQSAVAASSKRQPQAVFPGNAAVEEVLWRVLSLDMNARDASQILLALGHLRFRPPAAAAAALVDVYVRCLEKQQYTNNDLNAFLDGCALLGRRLSPAAVESCLEAVGAACSSNPPNAPRYISTAAWALAHLQQYDIEAWQQLAGLAAAAPIADWSAVNLCRLYQSYMHVRAEHGQAVQLPVQLLTAASAAALAQETSRQSTTRAFHSQVARELEAACPGEAVEVGQQVGPGGRSREAALKGWEEGWLQVNLAVPSLRLVVQTDGRYQYFHNDPEVPLPTTLARDRLLRSWGWHVISVPFTIPEPHRAEYLKQRVPSQ